MATEGGLTSGSDELRACEESVGELGPERGASGEVKESDGPQGAVHKTFLLKFDDSLDDCDGDGDCDGGCVDLRGEGWDYDGAVSRHARKQPAERSAADGLVCLGGVGCACMPLRRGVCIRANYLFFSVVLAECLLVVLKVFAGRCLTSSSRRYWLDAGARSCGGSHSPIPATRCLVAAQRMQTCRRQTVVMPCPHLLSDYTLRTRRVCLTTEGAGATTNGQATDGRVEAAEAALGVRGVFSTSAEATSSGDGVAACDRRPLLGAGGCSWLLQVALQPCLPARVRVAPVVRQSAAKGMCIGAVMVPGRGLNLKSTWAQEGGAGLRGSGAQAMGNCAVTGSGSWRSWRIRYGGRLTITSWASTLVATTSTGTRG